MGLPHTRLCGIAFSTCKHLINLHKLLFDFFKSINTQNNKSFVNTSNKCLHTFKRQTEIQCHNPIVYYSEISHFDYLSTYFKLFICFNLKCTLMGRNISKARFGQLPYVVLLGFPFKLPKTNKLLSLTKDNLLMKL